MTTRYEGAAAEWTHVTVHPAGTELAEDEVPEGQIALAFNYDEVFYLQGKPEEVRTLLQDALTKLENEEFERLRRTDSNDLTGGET